MRERERGKARVRRSSESAAQSRVGDSGTRSWREATSPVVITAHCRARGERVASERSVALRCRSESGAGGGAECLTRARLTDGLLGSASSEVCPGAWLENGRWEEEEKKQADAAGKVTNYGDSLLTESLPTVRTFQIDFLQLDATVDEHQRARPSGDNSVPRWTTSSSVASRRSG